MSAMIEVRGLSVVFDGFRAIDGIDLTVEQGELRFLIGPNGAGKTTLIDVITGLTRPTPARSSSTGAAWSACASTRSYGSASGGPSRPRWSSRSSPSWRTSTWPRRFRQPLWSLPRRRRGVADAVAEALETTGSDRWRTVPPECSPTGSGSGWRSACCSPRGPSCSCWTSRWPECRRYERERTGELMTSVAARPHGDRDRT